MDKISWPLSLESLTELVALGHIVIAEHKCFERKCARLTTKIFCAYVVPPRISMDYSSPTEFTNRRRYLEFYPTE
jgi:hypothetical protein